MYRSRNQSSDDLSFLTVTDLIDVLVRGRFVLAGTLAVCLAIGALYLATAERLYTSTAKILIDPSQVDPLSNRSGVEGIAITADSLYVDSELEIIRSRALLRQAAVRLGVPGDDAYSNPGLLDRVRGAIARVFSVGAQAATDEEARVQLRSEARIGRFIASVQSRRVMSSYIIAIDVAAVSPERASNGATAVANAYLDNTLESQYEISRRNNQWLQQRLAELQISVRLADEAVEQYRRENSLAGAAAGISLVDQTLANLNSQLILTRAEASAARSRYDQLQAVLDGGSADAVVEDVLDNPVVSRLRTEYADASRQSAEILARSGPEHEAYVNAQREVAQLRELIVTEIGRFAASYKSTWDVAQRRVAELEAAISETEAEKIGENEKSIRLRELLRLADSQRALYEAMLNTFNQNAQRVSIPTSHARLIEPALPPGAPSSPKLLMTVALSLLVGSAAGVGLCFLREGVRQSISDVETAESILGATYAGALGELSVDEHRPSPTRLRETASRLREQMPEARVASAVLEVYQSSFARLLGDGLNQTSEVMRAVQMSVRIHGDGAADNCGRVVGVASAVPGEGKSVTSELLAASMAASGKKTLLIDADYRKGELTRRTGLEDMASDWTPFSIVAGPEWGFDFVPSQTRAHLNELLSHLMSGDHSRFLKQAANDYDYVLVDLPPMLNLQDGRLLARDLDDVVFVIEWDKTPGAIVERALDASPELKGRLASFIFNKSDLSRLFKREFYYYGLATASAAPSEERFP